MASYTVEQKLFIVKTFYSSGNSCVFVQRKFREEFNVRDAPSRDSIYRFIRQFEATGSVSDVRKGHSGRPSIRSPDVLNAANTAITRSPQKSLRRLSQQLHVSYSTSRKVYLTDLSLFLYNIQLSQPLSEDGIDRRYNFSKEYGALLEENPNVVQVTWFSDEAHFHLNGYVNKQNTRFWATQNPHITVANPLHPERVTVWCALSSVGIFGLFSLMAQSILTSISTY